MKSVCFIVCRNGLGHAKRDLELAHAIVHARPDVHVDLVWHDHQRARLANWWLTRELEASPRVGFRYVDTCIRWSTDAAWYRDPRMLDWHRALAPLLGSYDLVLSDNLVEPLLYREDTILLASFFWHDVQASAFPDERVVSEYHEACTRLLADTEPQIVANRYFAMPAVLEQPRAVLVGMQRRASPAAPKARGEAVGVLFFGGSSPPVIEKAAEVLRTLTANGSQVRFRPYADAAVLELLGPTAPVEPFAFDADDYSEIDAVVARPGLGIVSDCIVSRTPIFCIQEENPELEHNAQTVVALGIGGYMNTPEALITDIRGFLTDELTSGRYPRALAALDLRGLDQTVSVITSQLG